MKRIAIFLILPLAILLNSCSSIKVVNDFDKEVDFGQYKTYAFHKPTIDKVKLNDLDKKRILHAIDHELAAKGMTKSENPDFIIGIYTKEHERIDIYQNYYGYGWWPYYHPFGYGGTNVSQTIEGTLFIDILDAKTNNLIWQGIGYSDIKARPMEKKEQQIKEMVEKILNTYPPTAAVK